MKKILLVACLAITIKSFAIGTVKGNGIFKSETREVGAFDGLSSAGLMNVEIIYGNSTKITVDGDENLLPYIETFVKDGVLKIKVKDLTIIRPQLPIKVHVQMTKITAISQSGSGSITGSGNFSNDGTTNFSMSGSGKIKLTFDKFTDADISMSGSGAIELKGIIADNLTAHQSGSGQVNCEESPCENVNVQLSGSGNIHVNAKTISARISGSGSVYYVGSASITEQHISGSGGIRKI